MLDEETALNIINADGKCPEADDRLRRLLVDLEREGISPQLIAAAQARMLLGFCAEHARHIDEFGWARFLLSAVADVMHHRSKTGQSRWVKKFFTQAHALYEEARREVRTDTVPPPLPPFAVEAAKPQGNA